MSEERNEDWFLDLLNDLLLDEEREGYLVGDIDSLVAKGILTNDKGLVVKMETGEVFHLIVRRAK